MPFPPRRAGGLAQPAPAACNRLPIGGKPDPQRTVTRATISEALTGVRNVGDARHVAEMASEIDRSKMDVCLQGARATADIERALSP